MSDTLQFVGRRSLPLNTERTTQHPERSTNVRYTSACRSSFPTTQHQKNDSTSRTLNECPIRFSLSVVVPDHSTPKKRVNFRTTQRMSDTLQFVGERSLLSTTDETQSIRRNNWSTGSFRSC